MLPLLLLPLLLTHDVGEDDVGVAAPVSVAFSVHSFFSVAVDVVVAVVVVADVVVVIADLTSDYASAVSVVIAWLASAVPDGEQPWGGSRRRLRRE